MRFAFFGDVVGRSGREGLAEHGILPNVWQARGVRRYAQGDTWVKDEFRGLIPDGKLATVTRIVNLSGGLLLPKFADRLREDQSLG